MSNKPDASCLQAIMSSEIETREGIERMERGERVNEEEKEEDQQVNRPRFKDQVHSVKPPAAVATETPIDEQEGQQHEDAPGIAPIYPHAAPVDESARAQQPEHRAAVPATGSTIFAEAVAAGSEPKRDFGVITCHFSIATYKVCWALSLVLVAVIFFVIGFVGDCSFCVPHCIERPTPEPTTETTDPVGPQDPSLAHWKVQDGGNGHYYKPFQVSDGISWTSAEAEAITMGGHLASITS